MVQLLRGDMSRRNNRPATEITTEPPDPPPSLICATCDRALLYLRSYISGPARQREQWDRYRCVTCGVQVVHAVSPGAGRGSEFIVTLPNNIRHAA